MEIISQVEFACDQIQMDGHPPIHDSAGRVPPKPLARRRRQELLGTF